VDPSESQKGPSKNCNRKEPNPPFLFCAHQEVDYCENCCSLAWSLRNKTDADKRTCWEVHKATLPQHLQCDDFENYLGFYKVLGCSKSTSDENIYAAWKEKDRAFKDIALSHHPDKCSPNDVRKMKIFEEVKAQHDDCAAAYRVLCSKDTDDQCNIIYSDRYEYDLECEI